MSQIEKLADEALGCCDLLQCELDHWKERAEAAEALLKSIAVRAYDCERIHTSVWERLWWKMRWWR